MSRDVLAGSNLLITGCSGSFGSAFMRAALDAGARRVVCYSRSEFLQAELKQAIGHDPRARFFLGDVRDLQRLTMAMQGVEIVVHAAALKRIECGEADPGEFVKTNIYGTANVIDAAHYCRVAKVVGLSTDKACQPSTLYGSTKHTAERLILAANNTRGAHGPIYAAVRYGNVAKSRGSVIPKWQALIAAGQEVTLTDPEATRYYMALSEAVDLVCWTLGHMRGGELVVPELPSYRLDDLLSALGQTRFRTTALADGEKRHESMIGPQEVPAFRRHGPYWSTKGTGDPLPAPLTSDTAPRMSVDDLRRRIAA